MFLAWLAAVPAPARADDTAAPGRAEVEAQLRLAAEAVEAARVEFEARDVQLKAARANLTRAESARNVAAERLAEAQALAAQGKAKPAA